MLAFASDYVKGSNTYALFLEAQRRDIPCIYKHKKGEMQFNDPKEIKVAITNNGRWIQNWNVKAKFNTTHGESFLGDASPEDGIDYYLLASEWDKKMHLRNGFAESQCIVTGKPRLDFLFKKSMTPHFLPPHNLDLQKPTIMYAPTWPRTQWGGGKKGFFANWFSSQHEEIQALCHLLKATADCNLIIRLHGHYARHFEHQVPDHIYEVIKNRPNVFVSSMITHPDSFDELNFADVLISDFSSISTDFLALDRPIIFIEEGCGWIYNNTGKWFLLPEERNTFGDMIDNYHDFDRAISDALNDPMKNSDMRKTYFRQLHGEFDGQNSVRAMDEILKRI